MGGQSPDGVGVRSQYQRVRPPRNTARILIKICCRQTTQFDASVAGVPLCKLRPGFRSPTNVNNILVAAQVYASACSVLGDRRRKSCAAAPQQQNEPFAGDFYEMEPDPEVEAPEPAKSPIHENKFDFDTQADRQAPATR